MLLRRCIPGRNFIHNSIQNICEFTAPQFIPKKRARCSQTMCRQHRASLAGRTRREEDIKTTPGCACPDSAKACRWLADKCVVVTHFSCPYLRHHCRMCIVQTFRSSSDDESARKCAPWAGWLLPYLKIAERLRFPLNVGDTLFFLLLCKDSHTFVQLQK